MPWGLIGAAAIGAASSAFGAIQQNKSAKAASQRQMDFQMEMSNTQYQRGMADMKKAGLNPILAYKQGGAGTPGGSTYSPVNVGASAASGSSSAVSTAKAALMFKLEKQKSIAETNTLYTQGTKNSDDADLARQSRYIGIIQEKIARQKLQQEYANTSSAKNLQMIEDSWYGKVMRWLDRTGRSINPFIGAK